MATVSARVDDNVKYDAEQVADSIGLSLSTVINVFLKRFVADKGFPFNVVMTEKMQVMNQFEKDRLIAIVEDAVADTTMRPPSNHFTFVDPITKQISTITK